MKTTNLFAVIGLLLLIILNSCDSDPNAALNNSELTIEFSDGTILTENKVEFYDSSTHTFFLKSALTQETSKTDFKIKVDGDSILGGVLHSCMYSSTPPTPYFISDCFFSGYDVLKIGYYGTNENVLDDSRILNSLMGNNKLRRGLSCQIDSIKVIKSAEQTNVVSTITIKNHDNIAYYIPDVNKMGDRYYTDYSGGLSFSNTDTGLTSFVKDSNSGARQRDGIKIEDLSKIGANSEVTYTYTSRNYHAIPTGEYKVSARFMGIVYTAANFELNQNDGRIWVGEIFSYKDLVIE